MSLKSNATSICIRVVKVNAAQNNFTCYMGREWAGLPASPFHNPFHVGKDGNREEVLQKFIAYWYAPEQEKLRTYALTRIGVHDTLGCWCKPLECHGDIIAGYIDWKRKEGWLW